MLYYKQSTYRKGCDVLRKLGCFLYIILLSIALGGLFIKYFQEPSTTSKEETVSTKEDGRENGSEIDSNSTEEGNITTSLYEVGEDDIEVSLAGKAKLEDQVLELDVETNLIKGTTVSIHLYSIDDMRSHIKDPKFIHLKNETSFTDEFDIPSEYKSGFEVEIKFSPDYPEESHYAELYGAKGEKLTGPFVHLIEYLSKDDIYKEANVKFYVLPDKQGRFETKFDEPDLSFPDDLGDTSIRLEAEAKADDQYLYVTGESNLLEGAIMNVSVVDKNEDYIDLGSFAKTNPDGSFDLVYEFGKEVNEEQDKFALILFSPLELSASWIIEAYGENGEKMEGNLVKDNYVRLLIPIEDLTD